MAVYLLSKRYTYESKDFKAEYNDFSVVLNQTGNVFQ